MQVADVVPVADSRFGTWRWSEPRQPEAPHRKALSTRLAGIRRFTPQALELESCWAKWRSRMAGTTKHLSMLPTEEIAPGRRFDRNTGFAVRGLTGGNTQQLGAYPRGLGRRSGWV